MRRNRVIKQCERCGKSVSIIKAREFKFRFCSKMCHGKTVLTKEVQAKIKHPTGPENHRWNNGITRRKDGYLLLNVGGKRLFQHRHVMEQYLGRKLSKDETVHHINHIRSDNRLENLELLSRSEHTIKYHKKKHYVKAKSA